MAKKVEGRRAKVRRLAREARDRLPDMREAASADERQKMEEYFAANAARREEKLRRRDA